MEEAEIYEFARQLQMTGRVTLPAYRAVEARWGVRGVVELTAVIGYYTMVSMTLNAHEIPLPDGEQDAACRTAETTGSCRFPRRLRAMSVPGLDGIERFRVTLAGGVATVLMTAPPVNAQDRRFREESVRGSSTCSPICRRRGRWC